MFANQSRDPVLVVGAGPTGLTIAAELFARGVDCRVVDRRPGPLVTSRAFTLHARTLEGFARAGCVDRFLERGLRHRGMAFHFRGGAVERLDFTALDTPYPYILIIEQQDTEAALREHLGSLGGTIEWNTRLDSVTTDSDGGITAVLDHTSRGGRGRTRMHPDWLVGCDGLHSTVRAHMGIDFPGDEYAGLQFRMMDARIARYPVSTDEIHYFIDADHMLLTTSLASGHRVLISDMRATPVANPAPDPHAARNAFQPVVDDWLPGARLSVPQWTTEFPIWRRQATQYRRGRLLLAGDAVHVGSPAAGLGMNNCIQDAHNLGWKLAAVATGRAPHELLDTYQAERLPIAVQVGDASSMLHQIMMAHGNPVEDRLDIIRQQPDFHYQAAARIAGLTHHYRDVLTRPPGLPRLDGLTPGDRAPDIPITSTTSVHDLLSHPHYTLLMLHRRAHSPLASGLAETTAPYHDLVRTVVITSPDIRADAPAGALVAHDARVHDHYGHPTDDTACLVRPDGHIALRIPAHPDTLHTALKEAVLT
ncbi:FAD-dependent monooxygenase [Nocardia africana]|uniref:FAD-dependent monooxygenase n=1 Tax=Nocardia africana TaxID=134964 RepID=A0ABW6NXH1_9NOCA